MSTKATAARIYEYGEPDVFRFETMDVPDPVAAASGAASVRVWHITSRGWDPWTERPLPEVVRVAYPHAIIQISERRQH